MIDEAMTYVCGRLNGSLQEQFMAVEDLVIFSPVLDSNGQRVGATHDRLALVVSNVELMDGAREGRMLPHRPAPSPIQFKLSCFVAMGHGAARYAEGFKMLEAAAGFFHSYPVFQRDVEGGMPDGLAQIRVEPVALDREALLQLWSQHGGQYLPSIFLELSLQEGGDRGAASVPPVTAVEVEI
jgi:hypothetical protein